MLDIYLLLMSFCFNAHEINVAYRYIMHMQDTRHHVNKRSIFVREMFSVSCIEHVDRIMQGFRLRCFTIVHMYSDHK